MSMIIDNGLIFTGHSSTQALHEVQAQISSAEILNQKIEGENLKEALKNLENLLDHSESKNS